ncbi:MAG: hypothetical protein MJE77_36130 [Proteobacteria bacterium]|nr:hypothetical protein [Pseudomonadota bacterium]
MAKILFVAASPNLLAKLDHDVELDAVEKSIKTAEYGGSLTFEHQLAARYRDLIERLGLGSPDIVHLSGHFEEGHLEPVQKPRTEPERRGAPPVGARGVENTGCI